MIKRFKLKERIDLIKKFKLRKIKAKDGKKRYLVIEKYYEYFDGELRPSERVIIHTKDRKQAKKSLRKCRDVNRVKGRIVK